MSDELRTELEKALQDNRSLEDIVSLLRHYKTRGLSQSEAYAVLEKMREKAADEASEDRILEVADFVAGFCSPHIKVWEG
jgi:hypothetical protein